MRLGTWATLLSTAAVFLSCSDKNDLYTPGPLGQTRQAVWTNPLVNSGLSPDEDTLQSNVVVRLVANENDPIGCTGFLLTPKIVLTTRYCISSNRCGSRPLVQIGARRQVSVKASTTKSPLVYGSSNKLQPDTTGDDLALVFLDSGVHETVDVPRQLLVAPAPLKRPGDERPKGNYVYPNLNVAGWSPLDVAGSERSEYRGQRQAYAQLGTSIWRYADISAAQEPLWFAPVFVGLNSPVFGLRDGDWGAPLFVREASSRRQIVGVASLLYDVRSDSGIKVTELPAAKDICTWKRTDQNGQPDNRWGCDAWIDITAPQQKAWLENAMTDTTRGANWRASHAFPGDPNGLPRLGEVDYGGECQKNADADCDYWFDQNQDKSQRDNCPGVPNIDQLDGNDDGAGAACDPCDGKPAGTQCDPVTDLVPASKSFTEGSTRRLSDANSTEPVSANNVFRALQSANRTSIAEYYANTRMLACSCPDESAICTDSRKLCNRKNIRTPDLKVWRDMTIVRTASPSSSYTRYVPSLHKGTRGQTTANEDEWAWAYWRNYSDSELGGAPQSTNTMPSPVFAGTVWSWVKNFSVNSQPNENDSVTEDQRADFRQSTIAFTLTEQSNVVLRPNSPSVTTRWPDFLGCPNCSGSILHVDLGQLINVAHEVYSTEPTARRVAASLGTVTFSAVENRSARFRGLTNAKSPSGMASANAVTSTIRRWGQRALAVGYDAPTGISGASVLAVIDPDTHAVIQVYASEGQRTYGATRTNIDSPKEVRAGAFAAVLASGRSELVFFGEKARKSHGGLSMRVIDVKTGAQKEEMVSGLTESLGVLAAAYSSEENAFIVLDVGVEANRRMVRLVRIDDSRHARVIGQWQQTAAYDEYALAIGHRNMITITATKADKHAVVIVDAYKPEIIRTVVVGNRPFAVPAVFTEKGLSLVYSNSIGAEPTLSLIDPDQPPPAGFGLGQMERVVVSDGKQVF